MPGKRCTSGPGCTRRTNLSGGTLCNCGLQCQCSGTSNYIKGWNVSVYGITAASFATPIVDANFVWTGFVPITLQSQNGISWPACGGWFQYFTGPPPNPSFSYNAFVLIDVQNDTDPSTGTPIDTISIYVGTANENGGRAFVGHTPSRMVCDGSVTYTVANEFTSSAGGNDGYNGYVTLTPVPA